MDRFPTGTLAYYDGYLGPEPCKVVAVKGDDVTVIHTADRAGGVRRGQYGTYRASRVVPRSKMILRSRQYHIVTDFTWVDGGEVPEDATFVHVSAPWLGPPIR
jgi:hypothetical protein